jgi:hypothetical protein
MTDESTSFFVHIVESPSPSDLLDGFTEGRMLCSFLELAQIPCIYNLAVDRTQFNESLSTRMDHGIERFQMEPILHLSMHGNHDGIQLTHQRVAGELITWKELADAIKPVNHSVGGGLGICMSSCGGWHGRQMAQVFQAEDVPMGWIVGSSSTVNLCDVALAFCVFYRGLQRGDSIDLLIPAVKAASGITDFDLALGHVVHQQYRDKLAKSF